MLEIQKKLISYNYSKRSEKAKFIVIHDVGATGSTAQNNRDYFAGGDRQASADFFIDSNNIIQIIDYHTNYSWAIGDGAGKYGKTNGNSLSIEMCLESNGQPTTKTIQNTLDLTKYLMKELSIESVNVVRHYDCSHKNCPGSFSSNNWSAWTLFKKQLATTITPTLVSAAIKYRKPVIITKICNAIDSNGGIAKTFKIGDEITIINEQNGYFYCTLGKFPKADCKLVVDASVIPKVEDITYRVVTGSFVDKSNADKRVEELKKAGVESFITTK